MEFGGRKSKTPFSLAEFENAPFLFLQESLVYPAGADRQSSSQSTALNPSEDVLPVVRRNVESNIAATATAVGRVETSDSATEKAQNIDSAANNSPDRQEPCSFNCLYCLKNNRLRIEENNTNAVSQDCSKEEQNPESLSNENEPTAKTERAINVSTVSHCEICKEGDPERFCLDCEQHICLKCLVWHNRFKANTSHNVRQFYKSACNTFIVSEVLHANKKDVHKKCPEHELMQLNIYCSNCDVYICAKCYVDQHRKHEIVFIRFKLKEEKLKMESLISQYKTAIAEHVKKSKAFRESTALVDEEEEEVTSQIKSRARAAKNEMNKYVKGLLKGVKKFYTDYRQQRAYFMHHSEVSLSTMKSKLSFLESCLSDLSLEAVTEKRGGDDSNFLPSWTAFQLTHEGSSRTSSSTFSRNVNATLDRCHVYENPHDLHEAIHQLLLYIGDIQF